MRQAPASVPICVDASLAAATLLPEPASAAAVIAWRRWTQAGRLLLVPPHFAAEVLTAIRRATLRGRITDDEESVALDLFLTGTRRNVRIRSGSPQVWRRACEMSRELRRANVYDTLYLALAERAGAEFWTADDNLVRAVEASGQPAPADVHLLTP